MTRNRWMTVAVLVAVAAAVLGCSPDEEGTGPGEGGDRWVPGDGSDGGTDAVPDYVPETGDNCAERARWIYLVAANKNLIRFYPDTLTLETIGPMDCPAGLGESPFSMSVDRSATAWVLYSPALMGGGKLYRVDTSNARCEATSFVPAQRNFEVFGMGFVSNSSGSEDETLFVAGGPLLSVSTGNASLGTIDMPSLTLNRLGAVQGWPELTGTGLGDLWAFAPDTSPRRVMRLDKASGATLESFDLTALGTGSTEAWAFAFWGGRFYIFLKTMADASTNIWMFDPGDGSVVEVVHAIGVRIVGAGVSTCAPVVLI